ncbi:hypothetical protein D3C81_2123780 [compost metagenome]
MSKPDQVLNSLNRSLVIHRINDGKVVFVKSFSHDLGDVIVDKNERRILTDQFTNQLNIFLRSDQYATIDPFLLKSLLDLLKVTW